MGVSNIQLLCNASGSWNDSEPTCQSKQFVVTLRLLDTYAATLIHISIDNSVIKPPFKNLIDNFLTKCPKMSKVCLHLKSDF